MFHSSHDGTWLYRAVEIVGIIGLYSMRHHRHLRLCMRIDNTTINKQRGPVRDRPLTSLSSGVSPNAAAQHVPKLSASLLKVCLQSVPVRPASLSLSCFATVSGTTDALLNVYQNQLQTIYLFICLLNWNIMIIPMVVCVSLTVVTLDN